MNTSTEKMMGALIVAQGIVWVGAIVACAIGLRGDAHASGILLALTFSAVMSLLILLFGMFEITKRSKSKSDA